jgi:aromatic-L-amino-acid decarboxylase
VEGLQHHVREHVRLAQEFARGLQASPDFELVVPPPLNLVCFRHRAGNDFNRKLLEALNQTGKIYLTHTLLKEHFVLRFCVGQTNTRESHVRAAWNLIQETARRLS